MLGTGALLLPSYVSADVRPPTLTEFRDYAPELSYYTSSDAYNALAQTLQDALGRDAPTTTLATLKAQLRDAYLIARGRSELWRDERYLERALSCLSRYSFLDKTVGKVLAEEAVDRECLRDAQTTSARRRGTRARNAGAFSAAAVELASLSHGDASATASGGAAEATDAKSLTPVGDGTGE